MKLSEQYDEITGVKTTGGRGLKKKNIKPEVAQLEAELAEEEDKHKSALENADNLHDRVDKLEAENEALREFVLWVHKDECASLLAGNEQCDCGYALLTKEQDDE